MKKIIILALVLVASASFCPLEAKKKKKVEEPAAPVVEAVKLLNASDSVSYTAGMTFTKGLVSYLLQQKVDTAYMADFIRGFKDMISASGDPRQKTYVEDALLQDTTLFTMAAAETYFAEREKADKAAKEEKLYGPNRDAGIAFLAENAKKDSVITLPSGLQYKVLVAGKGEVPTVSDKVQVNYEGRLIDGTVFDASARHGDKPAEFMPTQVIKGWTEALTMMPVGSKWQLYIPSELAYGKRETGQIKPYSTLVFDVELVGIVKK